MDKKIIRAITAILLYALLIPTGHASKGGLTVYAAMTEGGDILASVIDEEGDSGHLKAGGFYHFALGYEQTLGTFGMRLTYGKKFDSMDADNGEAAITRFPMEATVYKMFARQHIFGVGGVFEKSTKFKLRINPESNTFVFDDAQGIMVNYGYYNGGIVEWGIRYTKIEYKHELLTPIDGSNYGLYINFFDRYEGRW